MNDSELDLLLKASALSAPPPRSFQHDVWCRIETAEFSGWKSRLNRFAERFLYSIARPTAATATCAAMILAGIWFGAKTAAPNADNEVAYVQSISPFAHNR